MSRPPSSSQLVYRDEVDLLTRRVDAYDRFAEPVLDAAPVPILFDVEALQALETALSAAEGLEIDAFLAALDEHFARTRADQDIQAFREARKPWKKLADEVVPVAIYLRQTKLRGRIRFPLDDQPPDAWLRGRGSESETGIEVTRVLGRSKVETAKSMKANGAVPGFLGLPDAATGEAYQAAVARGRVTHSRQGVAGLIETGIAQRLAGKSNSKFKGHTLLLVTPLSSLPSHDWAPMQQRLAPGAEQTAFDRIVLIDDRSSAGHIVLLDRTCSANASEPARA